MIFYSRENGKDGEKDYLDTKDFRDVFFEKDKFDCISDGLNEIEINYRLSYTEGSETIDFIAKAVLNGEEVEKTYVIDKPYLLVEQGAQAYYDEMMLDDIDLIKTGKAVLLQEMMTEISSRDIILIGVNTDSMALLVSDGNTIAVLDDISINSRTSIKADRFYSVIDIATITSGTLSIYLSNNKAFVGEVDNIIVDKNSATVRFSSSSTIETESPEYIKSSKLKSREDYDANRVKFISVESSAEASYDEFDDLF